MLTARELEALLRIDVKTIYTYVQKGLIPFVRIQSKLRFIRKEIFDWIDQQSFHPFSTNRQRLRHEQRQRVFASVGGNNLAIAESDLFLKTG